MKYRVKQLIALCVIVGMLGSTVPSFAVNREANIPIKIGYVEDFGVSYEESTNTYTGYFVDYFKKILQYTQNDYTIEWVPIVWETAPDLMKRGEIDAMVPTRMRNDLLEEFIFMDKDIGSNMLLLVTRESNESGYNDYAKINGGTLGIREGYEYLAVVESFLEEYEVNVEYKMVPHDGYEEGVIHGDYDYCIVNSMNLGIGLEIVAKLDHEPVYLVGNPTMEEVFADLDYGIERIEEVEFFFQEKLYISYYDQDVSTDYLMTAEDYELLLEQPVYNVLYSPVYSPLTYLDEEGDIVGISVEMLNGMVEDTGITLNWIDVTQHDEQILETIDISLLAPNYSNGYFKERQSIPYFYYPYVLVENYDYEGKSAVLGILNFYEIEERILDIVSSNGEISIYPNFNEMEIAFFNNEIGNMIVTNMVYNKMRSEVKGADYLVTPIDAKLDVTLAFGESISPDKIEVFNKLVGKLDSLEMEYLFSEHVTYTAPVEETLGDIIRNYWEVMGASFVIGSIFILILFLVWQRKKNKQLKKDTIMDQAIISCAKTLMEQLEVQEALSTLLEIIGTYYDGEFAYIYEENPAKNGNDESEISYVYTKKGVGYKNDYPYPTESSEGTKWKGFFQTSEYLFLQKGNQSKEEYAPCHTFFEEQENKNILLIPLRIRGTVLGVLGVANIQQNTKQFELVTTVSAFITNHIVKNQLNEELEQMSYHDSLTGLYNRNYYMSCVERSKMQPYEKIGIIFADVNGLKKANDYLGHEYGDLLLKWSAAFLQYHTEGKVCRIGGDEFVCFLERIEEVKFVECVNKLFNKIETYGDVHISLGCIWEERVIDIEKCVGAADQFMYENKQSYYAQKAGDPRSIEQQMEEFRISISHLEQQLERKKFD